MPNLQLIYRTIKSDEGHAQMSWDFQVPEPFKSVRNVGHDLFDHDFEQMLELDLNPWQEEVCSLGSYQYRESVYRHGSNTNTPAKAVSCALIHWRRGGRKPWDASKLFTVEDREQSLWSEFHQHAIAQMKRMDEFDSQTAESIATFLVSGRRRLTEAGFGIDDMPRVASLLHMSGGIVNGICSALFHTGCPEADIDISVTKRTGLAVAIAQDEYKQHETTVLF